MIAAMLAATDGGGIFFFLMIAVIGFINWLAERKRKIAEEEAARKQADAQPETPHRPISSGESEQDRLRRFLEALGVPADSPAPPPLQQPAPARVPRPANVPAQRPMPRPPVPVVRAKPLRQFPLEPEPMESREPGSLQESARSIERVAEQFAELDKGFQLSAPVALPAARQATTARLAPVQPEFVHGQAEFVHGETVVRPGSVQAAAVLAMLRSPDDLRKALVLREILGPPPGLQS